MPIPSCLVQLLYPSRCLGCHQPVTATDTLCARCEESLPRLLPPVCERCGAPLAGAWDRSAVCPGCRRSAGAFQRARSAYRHDGVIRELLHRVKYQGYRRLGARLGMWLAAYALGAWTIEELDVVVPMPLTAARRAARGFNQAYWLARPVAAALGRPLDERVLIRVGHAPPQVGLSRAARHRNVQGVFAVPRSALAAARRILLVDDVFTTGSTADAASRALRDAGAASVEVLTLAREIASS